MSEVPPELLEWRRHIGADRHDEVWDGVLHMGPEPSISHQDLERRLLMWLGAHWEGAGHRLLHGVGVARPGVRSWVHDYRVPDISLLTSQGAAREVGDTHLEGGPDVVIELRSPGDETYDKLGFYCAVGCREIWVIDRDTRAIEIYAPDGELQPQRRLADADGWHRSALGIELRTVEQRLEVQLGGRGDTRQRMP
ncbi:MAG: Uma2 family endonuclease [Planctomycetes bacterium]|nr:Uma2 family endonuclease [Planctomycetota bacterium]